MRYSQNKNRTINISNLFFVINIIIILFLFVVFFVFIGLLSINYWILALVTIFLIIMTIANSFITKNEEKFLELKSELLSIALHEIRTPLTGIIWGTESLLKNSENMSPEQKKDIQTIDDYSRNLLLTINDCLDSSVAGKLDSKNICKEKIILSPFLDCIIKNFQLPLKEKCLDCSCDSSLSSDVCILGDKDRLKQAFNNLISNAIKYSNPKSKITFGCDKHDHSVVFWIRDQGIGIPIKDQARIFEGFYRADNAKQFVKNGTGLGLRYVKQIVELHRGKVWCTSEENKGSTFFVELLID